MRLIILVFMFLVLGCISSKIQNQNYILKEDIDYKKTVEMLSHADSVLLESILTESFRKTLDSLTISYNNPFSPSSILSLNVHKGETFKLVLLNSLNQPSGKILIKNISKNGVIYIHHSDIKSLFYNDKKYKCLIINEVNEIVKKTVVW